jgi:hypothetical protein
MDSGCWTTHMGRRLQRTLYPRYTIPRHVWLVHMRAISCDCEKYTVRTGHAVTVTGYRVQAFWLNEKCSRAVWLAKKTSSMLCRDRAVCRDFSHSYEIFSKRGTICLFSKACFSLPVLQISNLFVHRNECGRVADSLKAAGIRAVAYHAGLSDQQRVLTQEAWIKGQAKVNTLLLICILMSFS